MESLSKCDLFSLVNAEKYREDFGRRFSRIKTDKKTLAMKEVTGTI
ncbi:MAG: hypothetical protein HON76_03505 [Candidatus Scalindua sp.]|nr:hypothetical protein [Candidatus Scalindua sp.]